MSNLKNQKAKTLVVSKGAARENKKSATAKKPVTAIKTRSNSKQSTLIKLLQRPAGATVEEMAKATGWQNHSVHGMMSGVLKKRLGLAITSDKEKRGRVYRVAGGR